MFDPENPPELRVSQWLNTPDPLTLSALRGRVIVISAFQLLCADSLKHGLPQALRLRRAFKPEEVQVIGLHMVHEHKEMTPAKLKAFLAANKITIPVAIDALGEVPKVDLPQTMTAYNLRGTPSVMVFDRQGRLRRQYFGLVDDARLGAEIMGFAVEDPRASRETAIAIQRRLHACLADPPAHEHGDHAHAGHVHDESCGCGHDHGHEHHLHDYVADRSPKRRVDLARVPIAKVLPSLPQGRPKR
jgi:hypothetical protein